MKTSFVATVKQGYWGMFCWNGLSLDQQEFLRTKGYLEWGYKPEGTCPRWAELEITTMWDEFPGPRFYCLPCAVEYLIGQRDREHDGSSSTPLA